MNEAFLTIIVIAFFLSVGFLFYNTNKVLNHKDEPISGTKKVDKEY